MSKNLVLNSISGTTLYVVSIIVAFIMSPIYLKFLGNRDYGFWELVMSLMGYMGLLDLGVGPAIVRYVSIYDGKQDKEGLSQIVSTALLLFIMLGFLSMLLFLVLGSFTEQMFSIEINSIKNIKTVFILLGINAFLVFPTNVFIATLMGLQRHYFINILRIVQLIFSAVIYFKLLHRYPDNSLVILALLTPVFSFIQLLLLGVKLKTDPSVPTISISSLSISKAKELFVFGFKSLTMMIASRLQNLSIAPIIGYVLGLNSIVYFVMPNRLIDYAKGVSQAIGFPLAPYFGVTIGKGSHEDLVKSWLSTSLALQVVSLAMPILILFCGDSFLRLWLGHEYASSGKLVLHVLVIGLIADALASNAFRLLSALANHGKAATIWLLLSLLSVPAGLSAAKLWGTLGVAITVTAITMVGNMSTLFIACRLTEVKLKYYFLNTVYKLILSLFLLFLSLLFIRQFVVIENYFDLAVNVVTSLIVYSISIWFTLLSNADRSNILIKLKNNILKYV